MKRKINVWVNMDWFTMILYLTLIIIGWVTIYSAVYNEEHQSIFDFSQRYGKQIIWIAAALLLAFFVVIIESHFYSFFAFPLYAIFIFLLVLVLFAGHEVHGSRAWLQFGSVRFQPAEFAKIGTALFLSKYLSNLDLTSASFKEYLKIILLIIFPTLLISGQDAGTALVFLAFLIPVYREGMSSAAILIIVYGAIIFIFSFMFDRIYLAVGAVLLSLFILLFLHRKLKYVLLSLGLIVLFTGIFFLIDYFGNIEISRFLMLLGGFLPAALVLLILSYWHKIRYTFFLMIFVLGSFGVIYSIDYVFDNLLASHQQDRILNLLGLEDNPQGTGYNVNQSKIAIGSGGLYGKGFLQGTQTKFDFVPEQSTDFIFTTIGEEWGFIGAFVFMSLYVILLLRIIYIAERQKSNFSRIFGYCVFALLFFHFVINIGMTIGLAPVIGIPLPFISYGGSSLWAFTIMLFILLKLDVNRLKELK